MENYIKMRPDLLTPGPFAALRYRSFRLYFYLRFLFTCAAQLQTMILGFYIYERTHSTLAIAFTGLCEVVPAIGMALYGGYIADKMEKQQLLKYIHLTFLLSSLVIYLVTQKDTATHFPGLVLPVIYAMLFLSGVARAFYEPAMFTVYTASIPKEIYPNANNWNSLSWQSAFIIGPAAGGFIYARAGGMTTVMGTIMVLLCCALLLVLQLKKHPATAVPEPFRESFMAGIHFVFRNRLMLYTMSLDLFSVFFGGVLALLPVYAIDILKVGADGLGILRTASSAGAVLTMLMLLRFPPTAKPWRNLLVAVTGFGLAVIGFGLSHSYLLSLTFLFIQGAFDSISVVIRGTIMQLVTPPELRGRVSAVNSMFISSSSELGNFESGMAAKFLGTVPAVLLGGGLTLFIAGFTFFKTRKQLGLRLDDLQPANDSETTAKTGNH